MMLIILALSSLFKALSGFSKALESAKPIFLKVTYSAPGGLDSQGLEIWL
jgi:hypothetical protein